MSASRFAMINTLVSYALGGYKPRQCTVSDYMNCLFGNNAEYQQERHEFKIRNNFKGINEKFILWAFKNIWPKIAQEDEPKTLDEIIKRYEIVDLREFDEEPEPVLQCGLFEQIDKRNNGTMTGKEVYDMVKMAVKDTLQEMFVAILQNINK